VLLLTDLVDEVWVHTVTEFDGTSMQWVTKASWILTPRTRSWI
jgi:HSP90 family molecular chaperone